MEKSGSQYDSSSALPAYAKMGADTVPPRGSRFALWRIPCTAVLITALLVAGAITITAMAHKGSAHCQQPTNNSRPAGARDQVLDHDSTGHVELRGRNGESASETMTYNSALNTILINAPGNFSGSSPATIAIDFDRNVVFINIHDQNSCAGFALEDKLAQTAKNFTRNKEHNQVNDLVSNKMETENYRVAGIIPAGYVQAANGPIIRGMCSGRNSQWLELETDGETSGRQKRALDWDEWLWHHYPASPLQRPEQPRPWMML
ncbi:uncharacterized protein [Diadema antillarum]|uniref:uncharacterized protein n=1 Tax=Diadema antillarum TaxID=105358 RepID=UPI003A8436BA